MYINYKNKTNEIISITTENALFYYNQKQISSPYPIPIRLIDLQENQEIILSAITEIGTEESNAIFSPVSIITFKEHTINEYTFILESRGQITEKRILIVAIINIERNLNNFMNLINKNNDLKKLNEGSFTVNNEDHTLGYLISSGLQMHKDISFAGYSIPHPLVKELIINFVIKKNNIIDIISDVINYYIKLFNNIKNEIIKKL
jgi:DNA-directed RNA polymerase subunit L